MVGNEVQAVNGLSGNVVDIVVREVDGVVLGDIGPDTSRTLRKNDRRTRDCPCGNELRIQYVIQRIPLRHMDRDGLIKNPRPRERQGIAAIAPLAHHRIEELNILCQDALILGKRVRRICGVFAPTQRQYVDVGCFFLGH